MADQARPLRVWDAPTRLFHWAVVALVLISWVSGKQGWMRLHFLSGYSMATLLLFRIVWGFIGSETSRFARFLRSPLVAVHHLRQLRRREPDTQIGHNAAGGWMVLALLALLTAQVGLGLFANDDAVSQGPLADFAGKTLSDRLTVLHVLNFKLILAAVLLHVLAIGAYAVLKGHNLLRPMLTGRKTLPADLPQPATVSAWRAAIAFAIAAAVVAMFAKGP